MPMTMPRRHILHLAYTFYENDYRVIRYAETLAEQGADVEVVALKSNVEGANAWHNGVRIFRLERRTVNEKNALSYLFKIMLFLILSSIFISIRHLRRPYDVLHIHNLPDFLVFAAWLPKLMGARIILDIHDILPELFAGKFGVLENSFIFRFLVAVERLSCAFADHVIVANDIWRERLVLRSVAEKKCTTIMNYPDIQLFKPLPKSAKQKEGKFIMIYPGTLNYHQGLDVAIKAFARIKDELPNTEFHIYGVGPAEAELAALIHQLKLSDRVNLFPLQPIVKISKIMANADLGIVPKRANGFGNEAFSTKTLEFMACGVPIIVSGTRIDRYYFDESLVVFFKPGDERDLAEAMRNTINNKQKMHNMSQNALKYVSEKSWEKHKSLYEHILNRLLPNFSNKDKKN
jgi:glycosyltransferase involved in cell wall biosynthesis